MKKRYAFGSTARVGKDTAAEHLIQKFGGIRISFADPLYSILAFAQKTCHFPIEKDRQFLQYIGTEWARAKDPDIWLNLALEKIRSTQPETPIYITDVRFPNEFEALRKEGFVMVQINRGEKAEFGSGSTKHASETSLDSYEEKWNVVIDNNGTLEEFYNKLNALFCLK